MVRYGAEIILDTAVFWGCRAEWDTRAEHDAFTNVIGPDEYHEHVDNNFFTNDLGEMTFPTGAGPHGVATPTRADEGRRVDRAAGSDVRSLRPLAVHIIDRLYIGHGPEGKVFEQFEGYFTRREGPRDLANETEPSKMKI